jgi:hypothetical protein
MPNNYWGDPDDEPLPDWMNPDTYRNGNKLKKPASSLEDAVKEAMKKPAIDVSNVSWDNWKPIDE